MKTKIYMARIAMFFLNKVLGFFNRISTRLSLIVARITVGRDWLDEKVKLNEMVKKANERGDFRVTHLKKWSPKVVFYNLPDLIKMSTTFVFCMIWIIGAHSVKYLFQKAVGLFKKLNGQS